MTVQDGSITSSGTSRSQPSDIILLQDCAGCTIDSVNILYGSFAKAAIVDVGGQGNVIKNCFVEGQGVALMIRALDILSNNFIANNTGGLLVQSSTNSIYRNNTFAGGVVAFSSLDQVSGNAYLNNATHTGGMDIAGQ
jgi:hypothetical protein